MGVVVRAHGLLGEVRVRAFSPAAPNLQAGRRVVVRGERRRIRRARHDRDLWILLIDGITSRDDAVALQGQLLECPDNEVRRDDGESYFVHELIGLRAVTPDGEELGTISEVLQPGANDVYVVRNAAGRELLIPAIGDVIGAIDIGRGLMVITPLPGMLDET